jgi:hypothetical protein
MFLTREFDYHQHWKIIHMTKIMSWTGSCKGGVQGAGASKINRKLHHCRTATNIHWPPKLLGYWTEGLPTVFELLPTDTNGNTVGSQSACRFLPLCRIFCSYQIIITMILFCLFLFFFKRLDRHRERFKAKSNLSVACSSSVLVAIDVNILHLFDFHCQTLISKLSGSMDSLLGYLVSVSRNWIIVVNHLLAAVCDSIKQNAWIVIDELRVARYRIFKQLFSEVSSTEW